MRKNKNYHEEEGGGLKSGRGEGVQGNKKISHCEVCDIFRDTVTQRTRLLRVHVTSC